MEVHLMGGRAILSANESVVVPAEAIHGFTNLDDTELHLLAVLASASFEAVPESTGVPVRHWSSHND